MTEMSQNVPKIRQKQRLQYIAQNILFQSQEEMAEHCHVDRKTIQRDIIKWKQNGGFMDFLTKEFFHLYSLEKQQYPSKALDRVIYLMAKYEHTQQKKVRKGANTTTLLRKYRSILEEETEETVIRS